MKAQNPFQYWQFGRLVETIDAAGRIEALRTMTALELRSVLELPGLQATVRRAAEARLRAQERAKRAQTAIICRNRGKSAKVGG